jgi:hypothetical protein
MTCTIAISTSACIVFSDESTNADTARPTVMEAMARMTTASRISASGDGRYAPWRGNGTPVTPMRTSTAA